MADAARELALVAAAVQPTAASRWRFDASVGGSCWYELPPEGRLTSWELMQALLGLVEAADVGAGSISVEMDVRPGVDYRLTIARGQRDREPGRMVADAAYRYPGHPLPGRPRPPAAAPSGRPTDPVVLAAVTELFEEFCARYAAVRHKAPEFPPGLTEAAIVEAEASMGLRLPEDLRALYRLVGEDPEIGLLGRWCVCPLPWVVATYHEGRPGSYGWYDDLFTDEHVAFETEPFGHVRRLSGNDWWVTVARDFGMNYALVDLDPTEQGTYGQILSYGRDVYGPLDYLGASVLSRLRRVVESLRDLDPWPEGATDDDEPPWPPFDLDDDRPIARYDRHLDLRGRGVAEAVADLREPERVQVLRIFGGTGADDRGPVDLGGLAALTRLREINVLRAASVTGRLPVHLPVEALEVDAGNVDVTALTGHPTLWSLTLGAGVRVDLAHLSDIPALVRLKLGDLDGDVTPVAELDRLRVLIAAPGVWRRLRERDALPPALAAAGIAARGPDIAETTTWSRWIGDRMPGAPRSRPTIVIDGTFPAGTSAGQ